jgi:glycosyltransferase involved in cell wall biosynthesis
MKQKLLFIVNHLAFSDGVALSLRNLANSLDSRGFSITILCLFREDALFVRTFSSRVCIVRLFGFYFRGLNRLVRPIVPLIVLFNPVFRDDYDSVIAYQRGLPTSIVASLKGKRFPNKVGFVHGLDLSQRGVHKTFSRIVCISEDAKKSLESFYDKPERIVHIKNIYDFSEISRLSDAPVTRNFADFISGSFSFCWASRITREKGIDLLICACAILKGTSIKVAIIGDGPNFGEFDSLIGQLDLRSSVRLFGAITNPYPYFKKCNAFVCPSRSEGMSTAVVEAVLLKKAVVSTDVGGASEILLNPTVGLIVPSSPNSLADGMKKLASGFAIPEKNFSLAAQKFSTKKITDQYVDLFRSFRRCR